MKEKKIVNKEERSRFILASSSIRIIARMIDLAILFLFCFFTGVAIFYHGVWIITNHQISYGSYLPILFGHNLNQFTKSQLGLMFDGWKYCLFSFEIFIVFFLWFIFIPYFLKGRSIGKLICHITTINLSNKKYFFWYLIKKEFFLWILMSIVLLIYGFVCLSLKQQAYLFNINYIQKSNTNGYESFNSVYIFVFLFSVAGLIDIVIVVWMLFSSHKMNLQDNFSKTTVIYTKIWQDEKKNSNVSYDSKKEKKYFLPGEINIKELDTLLKKDKKRK